VSSPRAAISPSMPSSVPASNRARLLASFLAVYIIWGSTYLAIRFAIETLPPLLMAGARFLLAGLIMFTWAWLCGARPSRAHWIAGAIMGILLLAGGNGLVVWAEQSVPSSLTALLISLTPLWMTLIDWLRPGGARPSLPVAAGLALGFAGIVLLIAPWERGVGAGALNLGGIALVLVASCSWAAGSLYGRGAKLPASPVLGTGIEMLAGGGVLLAAALLTGEAGQLHLDHVSARSGLAFGYLVVFGSIVAFTAYVWLLKHTTIARASTYAYVNPVVAVFLGWAFAGEQLTARTWLAAAVIVAAVVVITTFRGRAAATSSTEITSEDTTLAGPALAGARK
jgi:drug/metabolite transporter (DMT)-like permease